MRVTLMQVRILLGALKMADVQIRTRSSCRDFENVGRSSPTAEAGSGEPFCAGSSPACGMSDAPRKRGG